MRKNEVAKIRIKKKKYGFGRKLQVEKLRFPPGFQEEGESRTRLLSKGVIYEVHLLDWTDRTDIDGNGCFLKTIVTPADYKEYQKPTERDEVVITVSVSMVGTDPAIAPDTTRTELYRKEAWATNLESEELAQSLRKILETMKLGEKSQVLVSLKHIQEHDTPVWETLVGKAEEAGIALEGHLLVDVELHSLVKVEDWFKDEAGTGLKRLLKKGKGSHPNIDSEVELLLRITVNGEVVVNNFPPETDTIEKLKALDVVQAQGAYKFNIDIYTLPSVLIKVLKTMQRGSIVEFETTRTDKLRTNFPNHVFD